MRRMALMVVIAGLLGGCHEGVDTADKAENRTGQSSWAVVRPGATQVRKAGAIAPYTDRGMLFSYTNAQPIRRGATTRREVQISEDHAIRAVAMGEMTIPSPAGMPIRLEYARRVEHKDGNWTFIGKPVNARPGEQAVITFGEKAVFGLVPNGDSEPLQITTQNGRTYVVETDGSKLKWAASVQADFIAPLTEAAAGDERVRSLNMSAAGADRVSEPLPLTASDIRTPSNTIDVALGFTPGMAARYGGNAQAVTRLTAMVDTANAALAASQVDAQFRLVASVPVDFADNTSNRTTLFQLSGLSCTTSSGGQLPDGGVSCTPAARPAALEPLIAARDEFGADLVGLVRTFQSPENGSCGIGWLVGNGQSTIDSADADFGYSVSSDTEGSVYPDPEGGACRSDTLAHELGHNLGLQHDREYAADGDGLDPEEFGATAYAFGYLAAPDAGNFVDVMAPRRANVPSRLLYSNPDLMCGSFPCGVDNESDAARALRITIPLVAQFRATLVALSSLRNDFNGDGFSDILWRNDSNGQSQIWLAADNSSQQAMPPVSLSWRIVGTGDFNGDGLSDVLWRNTSDGRNVIWRSGNSATQQPVATVGNQQWQVVGVADFDGDGQADILWRNSSGANTIWRSGNNASQIAMASVTNQAWRVAGTGDFDGDGRADIFWRNSQTGQNTIWLGADSATQQAVATVGTQAWMVVGVNDFDGDGIADLLWRHNSTGQNTIWRSANNGTQMAVTTVANLAWRVVATGDYNGDGHGDILWRNSSTGQNLIWRSGSSATQVVLATVGSQAWKVAG